MIKFKSFPSRFPLLNRFIANRPLTLACLGAASLVVYWFGLLSPYNVYALHFRPLLDIASLTKGQPLAEARFVLTFALLSGLYYLAWRVCQGQQARRLWVVLLSSTVLINVALIWLYPIGAADLFDEIMHARLTAVYHANPFYDRPTQFTNDPFLHYMGWPSRPSAYGPLWELIEASVSRLAGNGMLANIVAFKVLNLLFYFGCLGLIAAILRRTAPERALQGVCLFALNPLVTYEIIGNGHNDIVMVVFILLAVWALTRRWLVFSMVAATAGMLVKFIPALLLPILVVYICRTLTTWKARLGVLAASGAVCLALVVITYAPFWRNTDVFGLKYKDGLFTTSLPAMIQANLEKRMGVEPSQHVVTDGALVFMGLAMVMAVWRTWVESTPSAGQSNTGQWLAPVKAGTFILLCYLMFACLWFQSWYGVWPLALAALLPEGEMGRLAVLLSYAAIWKTIIFDFFIDPGSRLPLRVWRETWLAPATLGVVWAYGLYLLGQKVGGAYQQWRAKGWPSRLGLGSGSGTAPL